MYREPPSLAQLQMPGNVDSSGRITPVHDWGTLVPMILDHIESGGSVHKMCRENEQRKRVFPSAGEVMRKLSSPEYLDEYEHAKQIAAETLGDIYTDTIHKVLDEEIDPKNARVAMGGIAARMGHMAPEKYNDRVATTNHNLTVSIRGELQQQIERANQRVIDITPVEVVDGDD